MSSSSGAENRNRIEQFPGTRNEINDNWRYLPDELAWIENDLFEKLRNARLIASSRNQAITDLSMINPDISPVRFCIDKLSEAIVKPQNQRYSVARGIRKLREAFACKYLSRFAVKVSPDTEISINNGTKDAILHILKVSSLPGDSILLPTPTYPLYRSAALLHSLIPCYFKVDVDEEKMLSEIVEKIREQKPKLLLLNFPNNPGGICVSRNFYQKLLPVVRAYDIFVINDFVYGELGFSTKSGNTQYQASLLSVDGFKENAVETYSMSKAYSVPGWRIGAVIGNNEIIKNVSMLKSQTDYGAYLPLQYAAAATLSYQGDLTSHIVNQYQSRCLLLSDGLLKSGFKLHSPNAGSCVWAELPECFSGEDPGLDFALNCLERFNILVTPGGVFGKQFSRYIRVAAVRGIDELSSILDKFAEIVREYSI